jgi:hypothetical protein
MSGLEIVAGVAAIVGAFNGSVTLYRSWRDKRRERLENAQNQNLERSLRIGGATVQREYDTHFARLGRQFAVGDGMYLYLRHLKARSSDGSDVRGTCLPHAKSQMCADFARSSTIISRSLHNTPCTLFCAVPFFWEFTLHASFKLLRT